MAENMITADMQLGAVDRETTQTLLDLLNPLHGSLDEQTYDEYRTGENAALGVLPDAEFAVTITAKMERDLTQAVCILENRLRYAPPTVEGPPSIPRDLTPEAIKIGVEWGQGIDGLTVTEIWTAIYDHFAKASVNS